MCNFKEMTSDEAESQAAIADFLGGMLQLRSPDIGQVLSRSSGIATNRDCDLLCPVRFPC